MEKKKDINAEKSTMDATVETERIVEDSCILIRQPLNGDVEIMPKSICEPDKANPDIMKELQAMASVMRNKGGKLRLVFENIDGEQNSQS